MRFWKRKGPTKWKPKRPEERPIEVRMNGKIRLFRDPITSKKDYTRQKFGFLLAMLMSVVPMLLEDELPDDYLMIPTALGIAFPLWGLKRLEKKHEIGKTSWLEFDEPPNYRILK